MSEAVSLHLSVFIKEYLMEHQEIVERVTRAVVEELTSKKSCAGNAVRQTETPVIQIAPKDLNRYIDHTLLKPEATDEMIEKLCREAVEHRFYSVCVNSSWVERCKKITRNSDTKVCAVVGFPLGAMDSRTKGLETRHAVENGADEIDMVIHIGALKSGNFAYVENDIKAVLRACRQTTVLKVIIEAALLTDDEKVTACQLAQKSGAHFVKTSTGFAQGGATVEDVALMRRIVGEKTGVKAAGGIRSYDDAIRMIAAGANRLGASSGIEIIQGGSSSENY